MLLSRRLLCFVLGLLAVGSATAQKIIITPDQATGVFSKGTQASWSVRSEGEGLKGVSAVFRVKLGGLKTIASGEITLQESPSTIRADGLPAGWMLLEVEAKLASGSSIKALGGALFAPEDIAPASARPEDFDSFWNAKIAELRSAPSQPITEPEASGREGAVYELVTLEGWKGAKVYGQLAKPTTHEKLPALLIVQWAGVYGLEKSWVVDRASEGWLALNIQAHELPVRRTSEFFKEQSEGPLKSYPALGADSRETSYFLRMYLACIRAADYLASRPEWNGKVMVVTGGSQGGLQAMVTAALHEKVTGALCSVPAGCDQSSLLAERSPGWPMWPWFAQGPNAEKIKATAPYFDVVNFSPRISCPLLVGVGGIDTVCPPPGIFAAVNLVKSRKEVVYMPMADHMGGHGDYYRRNQAWMAALKSGSVPPEP